MADEPEDDPKPVLDENGVVISAGKLEVGIIVNPNDFELGTAPEFGDSPMLVFKKDGRAIHALAFTEGAGEKLLLSFAALLSLYFGAAGEMEDPTFIAPENKKKKPTLH